MLLRVFDKINLLYYSWITLLLEKGLSPAWLPLSLSTPKCRVLDVWTSGPQMGTAFPPLWFRLLWTSFPTTWTSHKLFRPRGCAAASIQIKFSMKVSKHVQNRSNPVYYILTNIISLDTVDFTECDPMLRITTLWFSESMSPLSETDDIIQNDFLNTQFMRYCDVVHSA